jgi:hypothetical protein
MPSLFQGADGLPGAPRGFGQFLLGHLIVLEAKASNPVPDGSPTHDPTVLPSRMRTVTALVTRPTNMLP